MAAKISCDFLQFMGYPPSKGIQGQTMSSTMKMAVAATGRDLFRSTGFPRGSQTNNVSELAGAVIYWTDRLDVWEVVGSIL